MQTCIVCKNEMESLSPLGELRPGNLEQYNCKQCSYTKFLIVEAFLPDIIHYKDYLVKSGQTIARYSLLNETRIIFNGETVTLKYLISDDVMIKYINRDIGKLFNFR